MNSILTIVMVIFLVVGYLTLAKLFYKFPDKLVIVVTIFSAIWVTTIMVLRSTSGPNPTPEPKSNKYKCNKGNCMLDSKGMLSLEDCKRSCKPKSSSVLDVEYLTIEYNPNDYTATDTISPWFNESITQMKKGDVAIFMTDYMIIHQTILDNMKSAMKNGAKFVLGADRWYICGNPYTCNGDNTCPNCSGSGSKPDNCSCNIPQVGGCNTFNNILETLDYCNNTDKIILVDQPTNKDDSKLWGHAHRKIVNFYYKNSDKARLICGSWNIDADLNRRNLGVKETSLGISTNLSDGFAQYMLQIDIDTLTPIVTYAVVSKELIPLLNSLKSQQGYPKLPLSCNVNWSDNTPGYTPSKGTDNDVEIWLGISPPAVDPANEFTSPKGVVYGNNNPPKGDDNWQDQYNNMVQKSSLCAENGTGYNNGTFASWCTKDGKVVSLDFAKGGTWAGLLFQKFFEQSMKSPFINISMYIGFDIGAPCEYLSGTWGWGCTGGDYHSPGWYQHTFPLLFPFLRDYVSNKDASLRIMTGEYNSNNDSNWTPWIWDTAFKSLDNDEKHRIHWKWFNQGPNGAVLGCQNSCGPSGCCRNHEKLYMSDENVLVSSGHPQRGYYSDINGINNDILFLKAKGLAGVFNLHYKTQWTKQGVTVDSNNSTEACSNQSGCWVDSNWDIYTKSNDKVFSK